MAGRIEKRVVWNPRHENKFIIGGGSQITLYEWDADVPEFRLVSSQSDLQYLKCFAWSPDTHINDLVAVGSSTGKVDLLRLEAGKHARNNVVSTGPIATLLSRNQRSCNALSFSYVDPNLLAVGYDKVRGEPSLMVWDVETAATVATVRLQDHSSPQSSKANPIRIDRPRFSYAHAELITCVSFFPHSPHTVLAGVSNLWLRQYDLRTPGNHTSQANANKVQGLATDPLNANQFASFGEGTVAIWDARRVTHPLLAFTTKDASADGARYHANDTFTAIEFSPVRSGTLATLTKEDTSVRFWNIQHSNPVEANRGSGATHPTRDSSKESSRSSRIRLGWTATASGILPTWATQAETSPVRFSQDATSLLGNVLLADTYKTKAFGRQLVSFALAPSPVEHPSTSSVVVINKDGDIEMAGVHDAPTRPVWSARGEMVIAVSTKCRFFPGFHDIEPPPEPWEIDIPEDEETRQEKSVDRQSRGKSRARSRIISLDERDFPPLSAAADSASFRRSRTRTFSPAAIRQYPIDSKTSRLQEVSESLPANPTGHPRISHVDEHKKKRSTSKTGRSETPKLAPKAAAVNAQETTITKLVEGDVSMEIRSRVISGYGLQSLRHNVSVLSTRSPNPDGHLEDVWSWLIHSKNLLTFGTQQVHGFDFSYKGILDIWEGLEASPSQDITGLVDSLDLAGSSDPPLSAASDSQLAVDVNPSLPLRTRLSGHRSHGQQDAFHGNYNAALTALNSHNDVERSKWKFDIHTAKAPHRRLALSLCGWKVGEEEFSRWEQEGKLSQAACWLLFTNQGGRAIELLMRSKDESHQMLSGTFATLLQSGTSTRNQELRDFCSRLMNKLQDPYFRVMLSYIVFNDWSDVVEEGSIPLQERLAMAIRYLDDQELTSFLRRTTGDCCAKGRLEGLMLTGLTPRGMDLLQSYVDATSDVQSAAILGTMVSPSRFIDRRVDMWVEAYRELLDGWKLFHHRCQFDIERGKIIQEWAKANESTPLEWVKTQFIIRCNYCNAAVNSQMNLQKKYVRAGACPECGKSLPLCSVCLMSINVIPDPVRENNLLRATAQESADDAFVFCQTCRHGGHAGHILEWFFSTSDGRACPVPDCDCHCDEEFRNS